MQKTIARPVSCYGIGVHSGKKTQLTLKPASVGTGIVFVRTDVPGEKGFVVASYLNVYDTLMSTNIKNQYNITVGTVEHLLSALWGYGIDNVIIEIDGPEVPIMDGSSQPFIFMIECVGIANQNFPKKYIKLLKTIKVEDSGAEIIASPNDKLVLDFTIDYESKAIGQQHFIYTDNKDFKKDIAQARTFGFVSDVKFLQDKGLARGASLENAVAIDNEIILNQEGLRFKDEFVRHKVLDQIGDLYTCGANFIGNIHSYKAGHAINNKFLRTLLQDSSAYEILSENELAKTG